MLEAPQLLFRPAISMSAPQEVKVEFDLGRGRTELCSPVGPYANKRPVDALIQGRN